MKQLIRYAIPIPALLLLFASCIAEELPPEPEPSENNGKKLASIELFTRAYGFSAPAVRSGANEFEVGQTPWVLVFKGSGDDALFVEAAEAYQNTTGKIFVNLIPQTEVCRLLIAANLGESFYVRENGSFNPYPADYETINGKLTGKTLSEVCSILYTPPLGEPQIDRPFIGEPLPMSYLYTAAGGLNDGTVIDDNGTALGLRRAAAKLFVRNEDPDFTQLEIVRVGNAARRGWFYNLDGNPPAEIQPVDYIPESGYLAYVNADQSTEDDPIYLYESPENTTFIVILGLYRGEPYYYKMMLSEISRNNLYVCVIRKIEAPGFRTLADALVSRPSNLVDFEIAVSDVSSYEIAANNDFYLGVSNSVFIAYTPFGVPYHTFEAFTLATDCATDFPNSNQLNSRNLWADPILDILDPASIPLGVSQTVTIGFSDILGSNEARHPVYVNLRLGNLEKNVFVRRHGSIPAAGSVFTLQNFYNIAGNHVLAAGRVETGTEWIALGYGESPGEIAADPDRIVLDTPGTIYLHVAPNPTPQRRTGTAVFTATAPSFEGNLVSALQGTTYNIRVAVVQEGSIDIN